MGPSPPVGGADKLARAVLGHLFCFLRGPLNLNGIKEGRRQTELDLCGRYRKYRDCTADALHAVLCIIMIVFTASSVAAQYM